MKLALSIYNEKLATGKLQPPPTPNPKTPSSEQGIDPDSDLDEEEDLLSDDESQLIEDEM